MFSHVNIWHWFYCCIYTRCHILKWCCWKAHNKLPCYSGAYFKNCAISTNITQLIYLYRATRTAKKDRERIVVIILQHNWLGKTFKTLVLLRPSSHFYNVPLFVNWASACKKQEVRVKCFCCSHQVTRRTVHQVLKHASFDVFMFSPKQLL